MLVVLVCGVRESFIACRGRRVCSWVVMRCVEDFLILVREAIWGVGRSANVRMRVVDVRKMLDPCMSSH